MRISPIDIQQKQFRSRPFGYEKSGVDQFLELLAEELERLMRKNQDLQEELARTNATLGEMREREETLRETLVLTQKITEELKSTARREVDVMMAEAEIKSERLMRNAEDRRLQLIAEIQEIKRQKIDFEVGLRGLLEKHIRMLDLDDVALDHQDQESRMLEEPLPFAGQSGQHTESRVAKPSGPADETIEEAEFIGPDQEDATFGTSVRPSAEDRTPDLIFDFDSGEGYNEEDLLK